MTTSTARTTREPDRTEEAERREMFSFHPEILAEAGEFPRRIDVTEAGLASRNPTSADGPTRR